MEIDDLNQLQIDPSTGLYDLTQRTFQSVWNGITYYSYTIQEGEEQRPDLVAMSIYNSTDYIDIILDVNNISNPLNIKEGTTIIYPAIADIIQLRYSDTTQNITSLATPQKATQIDTNRQNYIENNFLSYLR